MFLKLILRASGESIYRFGLVLRYINHAEVNSYSMLLYFEYTDVGNFYQVGWGMISMVDAERRLLAKALEDIDNQQFVLLSDR